MNEPPLVRAAANVFKNLIYENRHQLTAGVIVAGWDSRFGGQVINKFYLSYLCIPSLRMNTRRVLNTISLCRL